MTRIPYPQNSTTRIPLPQNALVCNGPVSINSRDTPTIKGSMDCFVYCGYVYRQSRNSQF